MNPNPKWVPGKGRYSIQPATCVFRDGAPQELPEPRYCNTCNKFLKYDTWDEWPLFCSDRCENRWLDGN